MSNTEETKQGALTAKGRNTVKKPYEKPEVRHERVFETLALACGKVQVTQGQCHFNRKVS